jgi:hypothetical protein
MRSSKSLVLAGTLAMVAVIAMALGCSDDETPVAPPPADNGIQSLLGVVQDQVHAYLDTATGVMEAGLEVATYVDISTDDIGDVFMGGGFPDSTLDEHLWIISWLTDLQSDVAVTNIVDSLSYLVDNALSVNARNATAMFVKHNYSYVSADTTVSFTDITNHGNLQIDGLQGALATINGELVSTVREKEVTDESTVWNDWTIEIQATDLEFAKDGSSWTSGCPNGGTCTVNVEYTQARNEDIPTTTNWQFDVTFTDGSMAVDVTVGQLTTSYEHALCTP